ncbi:MAG: hypothetical protein QXH80_04720, partial [Candidatus Nanoarchaeia archaeon]
MNEVGIVQAIPLQKGHYGGPADTAIALITASKIPSGYYWGEDVFVGNSGCVRARPSYAAICTAANDDIISCFHLNGIYYVVKSNGTILYDSNGWATLSGANSTGTSRIYFDTISNSGSTTPIGIVSSPGVQGIAVSGTSGTALTPSNAKGLLGQDENRLFSYNGGKFYYSDRGTYNAGFSDETQFFTLGPSCYEVVAIMQVAGSLYIVKQSTSGNVLLYRKVSTNSMSTAGIDLTYFTAPLGIQDGFIPNDMDGITTLGGTIFMWMYGQGLVAVTESGADVIGDAIVAENNSNVNSAAILATATNFRLILVKPESKTFTYAVGVADGVVHGRWNIDVVCKG